MKILYKIFYVSLKNINIAIGFLQLSLIFFGGFYGKDIYSREKPSEMTSSSQAEQAAIFSFKTHTKGVVKISRGDVYLKMRMVGFLRLMISIWCRALVRTISLLSKNRVR